MEMEWSGNIDTETGIPFSISRTYSGTFWKLEIVPETGKIPEHFLEARIITEHIPETRKIPEKFRKPKKFRIKHVQETGKHSGTRSENRKISVTHLETEQKIY